MPDRYGDTPDTESVVDFDSRRQARETAAALESAAQQRQRLSESRSVHAPLTRDQSDAARVHRINTTSRAETHRNTLRIANCTLCDGDGYTPAGQVCDHIDHRPAAARGMVLIREALSKPPGGPVGRSDTDQTPKNGPEAARRPQSASESDQ